MVSPSGRLRVEDKMGSWFRGTLISYGSPNHKMKVMNLKRTLETTDLSLSVWFRPSALRSGSASLRLTDGHRS